MKNKITILFIIFGFLLMTNTVSAQSERKKIPIPGLYNTGVDNNKNILSDGDTDPHYVLSISSDASFPGPDSKVVYSDVFPLGAWIENDSKSKWIAPRSDAGEFNNYGMYVYTLYFSLNGFKPETAEIKGFWTTDNNGADILLNGNSTGHTTTYNAFSMGYFPFEMKQGFTHGTNSISFVVHNGEAPTGLRVMLYGEAEPIEAAMNEVK